MKRRIMLKLAVFLLLGAIVNVAVAWGCAFGANWSGPQSVRVISDQEIAWLAQRGEKPASRVSGNRGAGVGLWMCDLADSQWDAETKSLPSRPFQVIVFSSGFPFLSLTGEIWFHSRDWARANQQSVLINKPPDTEGIWDRGSVLLPFKCLWPGFAINTIFYAAILWLLVAAPFKLRRFIRTKRQRCPGCGYPLGTLGGPVCTECGVAVQIRQE